MNNNREQEALAAYLKLLQNKGADNALLKRRETFLSRLMESIAGKPSAGGVYRESVEKLLETLPTQDWPFFLAVAREYYPFWTSDIKAIAALNAESGFNVEPVQWQPAECNLKTLWTGLDKEKFSVAETWPLKAYMMALRQEGAEQSLVDTRAKLVKLLLVRLKDAPEKNHRIYRIAVDATLPLFSMKDTRKLFLTVVREFYYFWIGDPEAASHILSEASVSYL
ncbi:MAG TPA: hypothetical protein VD810_05550 [Methylophilaceae bacterium]|nr:hypothetical protein [Methylophilaceae bacterium]